MCTVRLSKVSICVEGLARLWGRSCQGGCRNLSGYMKIIDARYLHERQDQDLSRVLVGMKTVIIPSLPLAEVKLVACFR